MSAKTRARNPRFHFLDGLRGIAAVSVFVHHLYHGSEFKVPLSQMLPYFGEWLASLGARGVQIFFVLSGFVIAYSIRTMTVTPATAGNFILRRQIRLDPAFWIVLLLSFGNLLAIYHAHPAIAFHPTLRDLLASMFYVNNILHTRAILGVSWTLCLEIQFYLVLIFIAWLCQRSFAARAPMAQVILVAGLAFLSLGLRVNTFNDSDCPWFIGSWYLFAAGAMIFWTLHKRMNPIALWTLTILILAIGIWKQQPAMVIGGSCISIIYGVGLAGHLEDWLSARPLQYLGQISYSLYLIHVLVLDRVFRLGIKLTGLSHASAILWVTVATICAFVAAHLLYIFVERPTMRLAASLKPKSLPVIPLPKPVALAN